MGEPVFWLQPLASCASFMWVQMTTLIHGSCIVYQIMVETDSSLLHTDPVLKIAVPLGDSQGMKGGTGCERAMEREGFLLPHQSLRSCPTDTSDCASS